MIARVRRRTQFRAFTSPVSRRRRRGPLSIVAAPSVDPGVPRVAYAIGRSVGNAVERNRLRRRLRSALPSVESRLRPDRAYLIGASKGAQSLTYREIVVILGQLTSDPGLAAA